VDKAQSTNLREGDAAKGVPEKEGADDQAGEGLEQVARLPPVWLLPGAVMLGSPAGVAVLQLRGEVMGEKGNKACLLIVTSWNRDAGPLVAALTVDSRRVRR